MLLFLSFFRREVTKISNMHSGSDASNSLEVGEEQCSCSLERGVNYKCVCPVRDGTILFCIIVVFEDDFNEW